LSPVTARVLGVALVLLTMMVLPSAAQERPVRWTLQQADSGAMDATVLGLRLHADVDAGWYLYAQDQPAGGPSSLEIGAGSGFALAAVDAPRPRTFADRNFDLFTRIYRQSTTFDVQLFAPDERPAAAEVLVTFQACTERYCLPARTDTVRLALSASAVPAAAVAPLPALPVPPATEPGAAPPAVVGPGASAATEPVVAQADQAAAAPIQRGASVRLGSTGASLASFLWLAVLMGALSLLTPCVFPMVPITVGFFAHRAGQGTALKNAAAYGVGIVATFTALGLLVAVVFGAGGVVRLAADPWLNLAVAALFIAFALNLLGVYEIRLPQRLLAHATSAGARRSDTTAAVLMGGAFSITSFTCTAPFVGTLLVLAAQGDWRWPLLGMSVFAAAFALPFVLLALMPERLSRLPRAGAWMTTLKATIGVVELAAAVKFISNADLVWHWGVFTRSVVIVCWMIAAAALCVLFLRGVRRRPWPRLGAAAVAAAVVVWLGSGLRGYRLGELEAFLPPAPEGLLLARAGSGELPWRVNDYDGTLRAAQAAGRPVIIDFTGYTCTNCRWMEANMFPRSEVRELLGEYVRVRLYTDGRGEPYHAQQRLQERLYGTVALPYYAVLAPDGRTRATFLGMTRDTREFVQFLHDGLDVTTPAAATP
jgi:thiol:disulfide interchange protein